MQAPTESTRFSPRGGGAEHPHARPRGRQPPLPVRWEDRLPDQEAKQARF